MATLNLPVPPKLPDESLVRRFQYSILLDDVTFQILLHWNSRDSSWTLDLFDAGGTAIVNGFGLRLGTDLLAPFRGYDIPAGTLQMVDTSATGTEATRDDLGTRVLLQYVEAA
jgi:hypothetical protein